MDYIKIRFGEDSDQAGSKFEKTIEEMFRSVNPLFNCSECSWKPQIDVYETAQEIVVLVEIAGVAKEDLDLEINNKAVKISGVRSEPPRVGNAKYRLAEIQYGRFERYLFLPAPVDTENVQASYANGFLKIQLTKLTYKKAHKIPIADG